MHLHAERPEASADSDSHGKTKRIKVQKGEIQIASRPPPGPGICGVGRRGGVAETYQKAMFFMFKGYMIKTQNRSNTEPHGVPEALDGFVGKVVEFSTTWRHRECLGPTKKASFFSLKAS